MSHAHAVLGKNTKNAACSDRALKPLMNTPFQENNPLYLSIDSVIVNFIDSFSFQQKQILLEAFIEITENIIDEYEGLTPMQILQARNIDFKDVILELALLLPEYAPILQKSMDEWQDEMYMEESELASELGLPFITNEFTPKLLVSDGTHVFALMQVAAFKKGINDGNIRLWYLVMAFLLNDSIPTVH